MKECLFPDLARNLYPEGARSKVDLSEEWSDERQAKSLFLLRKAADTGKDGLKIL